MLFTCNTKDFANAVAAASKIVNAHTTQPILANLLVTAADGEVSVRSTDLEITALHRFPGDIQQGGATTVPAKLFSNYLKNLSSGMLELTGTDIHTAVRVSTSKAQFNALPAEEFPPLPEAKPNSTFSIDAKTFREGVNATIFAASSEEARGSVLMGTYIEINKKSIALVATDGYRLAKWTSTLEKGIRSEAHYIVPSRALAEAAANVGSNVLLDLTALGSGEHVNQLSITGANTALTVRLVDGQYPNYRQVISANFDKKTIVDTADLISALNRAELISGDRASMVTLDCDDSTLIVTASSDTAGTAHEEISAEHTGDAIRIRFNARYLVEILKHVETEKVQLRLLGALNPVEITPVGLDDSTTKQFVLMPLLQ